MLPLIYAYLFTLALVSSLVFVRLARRIALRFGIIDKPHERKIHRQDQPLLGGVAIYVAFMCTLIIPFSWFLILKESELFSSLFPKLYDQFDFLTIFHPHIVTILGGATIMLILGLIDDRRGIGFSYKLKFTVQILTALILVKSGIRIEFMPTDFLNNLVTVLWIVGITNAFNLLDNMDGLAAGVALIAALIFGILTAIQDQIFSSMIYYVFAGSLLGFLFYNSFPAKIFMGDAGSLFIGFVLAALGVKTSYVVPESSSLLPVLIPVVVLGIPIYDTLSVIFIRLKERRPLFTGDKRHLSHRLVGGGMTQRSAVFFMYFVSACAGIPAILLPYVSIWSGILVLVLVIIIFISLSLFERKSEITLKNLYYFQGDKKIAEGVDV